MYDCVAAVLRRVTTFAAPLFCLAALSACSVLNSHAAAARQLFEGTDSNYWCWSREAGNGIPKPCVPKDAYAAIWQCVHEAPNRGDTLQSVERSREELIDCMHARGWVDYAVAIGR